MATPEDMRVDWVLFMETTISQFISEMEYSQEEKQKAGKNLLLTEHERMEQEMKHSEDILAWHREFNNAKDNINQVRKMIAATKGEFKDANACYGQCVKMDCCPVLRVQAKAKAAKVSDCVLMAQKNKIQRCDLKLKRVGKEVSLADLLNEHFQATETLKSLAQPQPQPKKSLSSSNKASSSPKDEGRSLELHAKAKFEEASWNVNRLDVAITKLRKKIAKCSVLSDLLDLFNPGPIPKDRAKELCGYMAKLLGPKVMKAAFL
jgi:hypothetical protein